LRTIGIAERLPLTLKLVAIDNTKMLADAHGKAGVDAQYDLLKGAVHGGPQFEADANTQKVLPFLNSVTGEPPGGGVMPETGGPPLVPTLLVGGSMVLLLVAGVVLRRLRPRP
jgi:hypothetical protein